MTQINLLPWREQARHAKKVRFGLMAAGGVVFAVIILLGLHGHYDRLISEQQARNAFITTALSTEQGEMNHLTAEKKQQLELLSQLNFIVNLRRADYKAVELLNGLTRVVPDAVFFTKVMRIGDQVTLFGRAKSNLQITQLMENIKAVPIFEQPQLSVITAKENTAGEERTFQVEFVQKQ